MFNYRIEFIFLFLLFFYACESSVSNSNSDSDDFEISTFSVIYNNQENDISIYTEVSNADNIESIVADIKNDTTLIETITLSQSNFNSSAFLYYGTIDLSDEVYIYNLDLIINFIDDSQVLESSYSFTSPIEPEIIDYTMPDIFQLDATEWSVLPIDIEIQNLNGADNISSVTYEVQAFYNGCDVNECIYDTNDDDTPDIDCNDPINNMTYISDPGWNFEYISSDFSNQNHLYHKDILMRPLNGAALYYNGECSDNDDDGVCDNFEITDCGRTGTVLFKFTVIDEDGLFNQIIDIPLEITE